MKIAISALSLLALAGIAQADLVAYWNFNSLTTATNNGTSYAPTTGTATLTANVANTDTAGTNFGINAFAGSTINAIGVDGAGQSLAIQGSSAEGNVAANNNGANIVMNFSLAGLADPTLSYATRDTATGFNSVQFSWSLDGTTYTDFGAAYDPTTSFAPISFDLSSIDALDGAANVFFRITFNGATSASGNNRIDNIQINAVAPTPGAAALLGLGGLALGRRRR